MIKILHKRRECELNGEKTINEYVNNKPENVVLIDVRTIEEYNGGYIPDSINIPLDEIEKIKDIVKDFNTPIYLYCRSGARSGTALNIVKKLGYVNVTNIGGIIDYSGTVKRGRLM